MILNSLKIKIAGLISLIVIAVIAFVAFFHYRDQKAVIETIVEKSSVLVAGSIVDNIQRSMKSGHTTSLNGILREAKNHEHIRELRIIDNEGTILYSADKGDIGKELTDEERSKIASERQNHFYFINKSNSLDSYTRILNKPECHSCHDSRKPVIALIETEISLDDLASSLLIEKRNTIIFSILIVILIVGTVFSFLTFYVDRPIRKLIASMQQIELGNFEVSSSIESSNEMNIISQHLNSMTSKLKHLMNSTVINERELARAEEKLAHHHDIELMNQKLEGQLREIENLNVTLEERIEEVEQANFTITDLASELEQNNRHLERAVRRLSTVNKIGLAINSTMDSDRLFNQIVRSTATTLEADIGYIVLYDKDQQTLNITNLICNGTLSAPQQALKMNDTSVSSWVINNRQPLLISDIGKTPQFARFSEMGFERKTMICAPLMAKRDVIGTICVVNKSDNSPFSNVELEMLTTIANQAAISIKNATLYEDQQQTYLNTIQALVTAIEASDSYTRGHSERVTRYSMEIGARLQLPNERLQILERAAILHDIGKIGIDLSLLHKEGKLSAHDIGQLQSHPAIGMKILAPIEFLADVRTCIGQHHERYDGMGYPNRLKHADQLLESRIIMVADAFDAMTSERPYRKALSLDVAMAELSENSGSQFDPKIAEIFTSIIEDGLFINHLRDTSPLEIKSVANA